MKIISLKAISLIDSISDTAYNCNIRSRKMDMRLTNQHFFNKSETELRFIMKDAADAAALWKNHDGATEAKYLEQLYDAGTVLNYLSQRKAV